MCAVVQKMYANVIEMWHKVLLQLAVRFLSNNKVLQIKSVQNSNNMPSSSLNAFFFGQNSHKKSMELVEKWPKNRFLYHEITNPSKIILNLTEFFISFHN